MLDVEFDFSKEANGRDPDRHSPTLMKYHRMLWQKPLRDNKLFNLTFSEKNRLTHSSDLGVFELSSDTIGHTYRKWKRMAHIIKQVPKSDIDSFLKTCRTMGGYIVFPANKINGNTINQERGTNTKIRDRWDLTVECIRRHYVGGDSPLYNTLIDVVSNDFKKVKFFLPFDDFQRVPTPKTKEEYIAYRQAVMLFINQRNTRILDSL